jgi:hypothetical protein
LHAYAREQNGSVNCAMSFGFICDAAGALLMSRGAPCPTYFELTFDPPEDIDDVVFHFSQMTFEAMCAHWKAIGAHAQPQSVNRAEVMSDGAFAWLLDIALSVATETDTEAGADHWAVFEPLSMRWLRAPVHAGTMLEFGLEWEQEPEAETRPTLH